MARKFKYVDFSKEGVEYRYYPKSNTLFDQDKYKMWTTEELPSLPVKYRGKMKWSLSLRNRDEWRMWDEIMTARRKVKLNNYTNGR